jgi:protease-3
MGLFNFRNLGGILLFTVIFTGTACRSTQTQFISAKPAQQDSIVKSPNDDREYASIILPNQLELVLVSDPHIEKSAAALSVAVGSFQEPKDFGGLAHYLEHMLFMGTKKYPEVGGYGEFVSRNGGTQNAYTEVDHTNYMVAVNNDAFDEALARFSDFFYQAMLNEKYADKERNAVHSEWTMKGPNDWVILGQLNGTTLNPDHPVSQFNWGNLESLADREHKSLQTALVEFYQKYYSANLMKGTLISHLSITEMKKLANKYFADIPNKNTPKPKMIAPVAMAEHLHKIVNYVPQTDMKQIQLKFVIENNARQFAVKPNGYVNYLLANEMPGTLASELRHAGLSESVYADYDASMYGNAGDLTIYIDLTEEGVNNRDRVMAAALKYLELLKTQGVDVKYFKEIKQSLQNNFRFKEKTNDYSYAMQIAANLQKVPAEYVLSSAYEYQRFNPQVIQNVLDQLTLNNARIFYIDQNQPTEKNMHYFAGKFKVNQITPALRAKWQHLSKEFALDLPRENNLMPNDFNLASAVHTDKPVQIVKEQGYSAHLGHSSQLQQPKGLLQIELNTGYAKQSARNHVLSNILARILNQHLTELQSEASTAGMGLSVGVSKGLSIGINGFTHKQDVLLTRALSHIKTFTLTESELANYTASFKSDMLSSKKQILLNQIFPKFRQVLNLDNYSDQALLSEVDSINMQDLTDFRDNILKKAHLQVFSFGNYTELQVKKLGGLVLQQLPKIREVAGIYLSPEMNVAPGDIYSWQEDIDMNDIAMADTYMKPLNIKDLATSSVLSQIIRPALFKQIRTEEQLGYSVGFFNQRIKEQLLLGYYIQSPAKGLAEVQQRIKKFRQIFTQTLTNLSDTDFEANKNSLLISLKQPAKNLQEEQGEFIDDWRIQNWQFDSKENLISAVNSVSHKDVVALYHQIESGKVFGRLLVQLRGNNFADKPYIQPENVKSIVDIDALHKIHLAL